jgi:hypothetical protein
MKILYLLILCVFLILYKQKGESPHGPDLKISCTTCHSSKGWKLDLEIYSFDHNKTKLALTGQHALLNCRQCHPTLVFSAAKPNCNECHTDMHQGSVGLDCSRCHNSASWLVSNITEIHQRSRFPLLGAHRTADCYTCHKSENMIRFDVLGINCIDCHRENYMSTTNPNHTEAGFSQDCSFCHPVNAFQWTGAGFNHNFFPLVDGHSSLQCSACHTTGNYADAKPDCYSCHQQDYLSTTNPNHQSLGFSTQCNQCHNLNPGWKPAKYTQHDAQFFPIYSGTHNGTWDLCSQCHTDPNNYAVFDCKTCHADAHRGENYTNAQCYSCHPKGIGEDK